MELPIFHPEDIGFLKPLEEFRKVIALGLTPLLPHPERYFYLSEKDLMSSLEIGVKIQSNYGSLAGLYGDEAKQNATLFVNLAIVRFRAIYRNADRPLTQHGTFMATYYPC